VVEAEFVLNVCEENPFNFVVAPEAAEYPFTGHREEIGEGKGRNCIINSPLPSGSGMKEIGAEFLDRLIPAAQDFEPDLVMISAGFDSRKGDPLGHFQLTDPDFAALTKMLMKFADENCNGRIVSVMEGGYNVAGLAAGVSAHVRSLRGD
jgi:acetoin utilization deacetylase AcuC-like enzyme